MIILKSEAEIAKMRKAGRVVGRCHEMIREQVQPGVTTAQLDRLIEEFLRREGAVPAFKGYRGFPASACVSIGAEVVHGIPGPRVLEAGEVVSIDIGAVVEGFVGDSAWTYPVGEIDAENQRLLAVTEAALYEGIACATVGRRLSDISHAVQAHVEAEGFSVVRELVGHGVGRQMHEDPQVPNYGPPGRGPRLKAGMTLAIEPMINAGAAAVRTLDDGWTVVTADGRCSAHFEHTVAVTDGTPLILTLP
ncbi:MAG TPA: type I methionyl aminopeptidase [Limnochordia bacterium]|nr:type I methionyl aminopeptidase [Limnochordia bacterium]